MNIETYLATKHLFSRHKGAWAWIVSLMTTGSVALGVAALVITLAVMTGFREDIQTKILGIQPHVVLLPWGRSLNPRDPKIMKALEHERDVVAWSPYINGQLLIGHQGQNSGAAVKGIDPEREPSVADLRGRLIEGHWEDLNKRLHDKPSIILGRELARNLGVHIGDVVWGVSPGDLARSLGGVPRVRQFSIGGILESGLYDYDTTLVYMNLPQAQELLGIAPEVSGIGIKIRRFDKADEVSRRLQTSIGGGVWATSWLALNKNLFSALALEKRMMFLILILVTLVSSFMIVSNLLLTVSQRVKEIGILRAMGAPPACIHKIFLIEGMLMGGTGTAAGLGVGVVLSQMLNKTKFISLPADVYYIDKLPAKVAWPDILAIALAAGTITLLATLYPARRAARLDPLEAIRFG